MLANRTTRTTLALAAALGLALPAAAAADDRADRDDRPNSAFDSLAPAPAGPGQGQGDPLADLQAARQAAMQQPVADEPEDPAERSARVNANYDDTIEIYREILDRQSTDSTWLQRRIENNEHLTERYGPQLTESQQRLRATQVAFMNRVLELKRERDRGELSEERFRELVVDEEHRFERQRARLVDDVSFYESEKTEAQRRLKALHDQKATVERERRMSQAARPAEPDPGDEVLQGLFGKLDELSGFRVRHTMDGASGQGSYDHFHGSRR